MQDLNQLMNKIVFSFKQIGWNNAILNYSSDGFSCNQRKYSLLPVFIITQHEHG